MSKKQFNPSTATEREAKLEQAKNLTDRLLSDIQKYFFFTGADLVQEDINELLLVWIKSEDYKESPTIHREGVIFTMQKLGEFITALHLQLLLMKTNPVLSKRLKRVEKI